MKTLAIDFGDRRVGLAVSDPAGRLAVPGRVIERTSDAHVVAEIVETVTEGSFERVVLGVPLRLDGRESGAARRIKSFGRKLAHQLKVPLLLRNEALTSVEAERLVDRGDKRPVDALAAMVLLQEVLDEEFAASAEPG